MEQSNILSTRILVVKLRCQIEEAFAQNDLTKALALTRQMDSIQLQRWEKQLSKPS